MPIGVLALQGGFAAHTAMLRSIGHEAVEVRTAADLTRVGGLVLPGGESTVMLRAIARDDLASALDAFVRAGKPVLATCAGMILAARSVAGPSQQSFGWLDIAVRRNAWGRQVDSFEALDDAGAHPLVFIRAPRIEDLGARVEVLARYRGEPVLVREDAVVAASFHPELTRDGSIHALTFASG